MFYYYLKNICKVKHRQYFKYSSYSRCHAVRAIIKLVYKYTSIGIISVVPGQVTLWAEKVLKCFLEFPNLRTDIWQLLIMSSNCVGI